MKKPVVLLILDGFGVDTPSKANPISLADKYNLDSLVSRFFTTTLYAHGEHVGLPSGAASNSEVGHLNIGAGKVVYQDILKINESIKDKSFFVNKYFIEAILKAKKSKNKLHLVGTLSHGFANSLIEHFYSLVDLIKSENLEEFYVHIILDGKDFDNKSGIGVIQDVNDRLTLIGSGKIASISGRAYGMDRDYNWDNTKLAYNAIVNGNAKHYFDNPVKAMNSFYSDEIYDDNIEPIVMVNKNNKPIATIDDGDSVIFFNFRPDKIRQLAKSIIVDDFDHFDKLKTLSNSYFVTMTEYEKDLNENIAFTNENVNVSLTEILSENGIKQLHISETEKYSHVTFFFNGEKDFVFKGEDRILIPSPYISFKDLKPDMSLFSIADAIIECLKEEKHDFIVANFVNCEVISTHCDFNKTLKSVEFVDRAVGEIVDGVLNKDGVVVITSDHGCAENIKTGNYKENTLNPVPFIVVGRDFINKKTFANFNILSSSEPTGNLGDIAPTILKIMGIKKPEEMFGTELI